MGTSWLICLYLLIHIFNFSHTTSLRCLCQSLPIIFQLPFSCSYSVIKSLIDGWMHQQLEQRLCFLDSSTLPARVTMYPISGQQEYAGVPCVTLEEGVTLHPSPFCCLGCEQDIWSSSIRPVATELHDKDGSLAGQRRLSLR